MSERWLAIEEAREAIKLRLETSAGRAEAVLETARKSGEVRTEEPIFLNMDGVVGMRPLTQVGERRFSEADLLDWLGRQYPSTTEPIAVASARFPGDVALIEEGRRMLASGMQKRAIARKLAERAEGAGTLKSKIDRLRRLL